MQSKGNLRQNVVVLTVNCIEHIYFSRFFLIIYNFSKSPVFLGYFCFFPSSIVTCIFLFFFTFDFLMRCGPTLIFLLHTPCDSFDKLTAQKSRQKVTLVWIPTKWNTLHKFLSTSHKYKVLQVFHVDLHQHKTQLQK